MHQSIETSAPPDARDIAGIYRVQIWDFTHFSFDSTLAPVGGGFNKMSLKPGPWGGDLT